MQFAAGHEFVVNEVQRNVLKPMEELAAQLHIKQKHLTTEGNKLQQQLETLIAAQQKARNKCIRTYQELESTRLLANQLFEARPTEQDDLEYATKMNDKYGHLVRELHNLDLAYVKAVKATRTFRYYYDTQMASILSAFEKLEMTRQHSILQCLRQYLDAHENALSAMLRNVNGVMETLGEAHPERDMQDFLSLHRTGAQPPPLPVYEAYRNDLDAHIPVKEVAIVEEKEKEVIEAEAFFISLTERLFESAKHNSNPEVAEKIETQNTFNSLVRETSISSKSSESMVVVSNKESTEEHILLMNNNFFGEDELNVAQMLLKTKSGRLAFSTVLNQHRGLSVPMPESEFKALEVLVMTFLDYALIDMHIGPTKIIMIMAQTFFKKNPNLSECMASASDHQVNSPAQEALRINADESPAILGSSSLPSPILMVTERIAPASDLSGLNSSSPVDVVASFFSSFLNTFSASDESWEKKLSGSPGEKRRILPSLVVPKMDMAIAKGIVSTPDREYLLSRVQCHPLWHNIAYWRESFFDSVRSELKNHENPPKWYTDLEQEETINQIKNIVFSQLASYAHNMCEFGLKVAERIEFIRVMADIYELSPEQTDFLVTQLALGSGSKF